MELNKMLKHMAWADNKLFTAIRDLPTENLALANHDADWTVGRGLMHILQGVEWYRFLLFDSQWSELRSPTTSAEVEALRLQLADMYASLIEAAAEPDAVIEFEDEGGQRRALRSVVLAQAAYHAAEHRAGIVATLHSHGQRSIHLDDYDVWAWFYKTQPQP